MHFSIKKSQTANSKTKLLIALMEQRWGERKRNKVEVSKCTNTHFTFKNKGFITHTGVKD